MVTGEPGRLTHALNPAEESARAAPENPEPPEPEAAGRVSRPVCLEKAFQVAERARASAAGC